MSEQYTTKKQTEQLFAAWHCSEPLPKKGMAVYINFPGMQIRSVKVTKTDFNATYGGKLYKLEFTEAVKC